MRQLILSLSLFVIFISGCSRVEPEEDELGSFDISPNNEQIVFSYTKNGTSSLYLIDVDGTHQKKFFDSKGVVNYCNPKYSPDGKRMVFVINHKDSINSTLCVCDSDGSNLNYLTDGKQIVTEATFSLDGESVFYCKANEYGSYSPIGRKDAHSFDIYSINLKNKKVTKITNLKSYGLSSISDYSDKHVLFYMSAGYGSGMYFCSKDGTSKPKRFVPSNDPEHDAHLYYQPIYSADLKVIGFTAPHLLYVMNLEDMNAKLVYTDDVSQGIKKMVFFKNQKKILFSLFGRFELNKVNLDGTELQTIPIVVR